MLLLNVPYAEKDEAKSLDAKWNPRLKKWYVTNSKDYYKFIKWFEEDYEERFLICDYIYLVSKNRKCPYCGFENNEIKVMITEYYNFYFEPDNDGEFYEYCSGAYSPRIIDLSPAKRLIKGKVLNFLKNNYNIDLVNKRLSQHCKFCDRQIKISPSFDFGIHSLEETKYFTLYKIPIEEDVFLDNVGWCSTDEYIYTYSKKIVV